MALVKIILQFHQAPMFKLDKKLYMLQTRLTILTVPQMY